MWRLFLSFSLFTFLVISLLWIFQILFLDDFYTAITKNSMKDTAAIIGATKESELQSACEEIALTSDCCILVFDKSGKTAATVENTAACMIHKLGSHNLNKYYSDAKEKGGETLITFSVTPPNSAEKEPIEKQAEEDAPFSPTIPNFPASNGEIKPPSNTDKEEAPVFSRLILAKIVPSEDGERFILLDCALTPLDSVRGTLEIQLLSISAIAALLALLVAFLLSRMLAKPLYGLSQSAMRLAEGDYNAPFSGGGCKEIDELSDSLSFTAGELSKVDSMQRELIANISHDLRTPLSLISGYSEAMRDIPGENTPENIQVIIDETAHLTNLVNSLIDISRLQAGNITLSPSRFSITEVLKEAVSRFSRLSGCEGYDFELIAPEDIFVYADREKLLQVLYNLIGNAINYTGSDKRITVKQTATEGTVRIDIIDTGKGIPEEQLPHIWKRYYKGDASKNHTRGTHTGGIGLSIVKDILDATGASFGVSSEIDQGSDFWFVLRRV